MCAPLYTHTHTHTHVLDFSSQLQNLPEKHHVLFSYTASERRSDGYHFISGYIAKQEPLIQHTWNEMQSSRLCLREAALFFLSFFSSPGSEKRRRALISSFFNKGAKRNVLIKSISEPFRKMTPNIWNNMWNVISLHYDPFRRLTALFLL